MGFLSLKQTRIRSQARTALAARLKAEVHDGLSLGEDDVVAVNEIACADPGCADRETIVLVMRAGEPTRVLRILSAMDEIGPDGIALLCTQEQLLRPSPTA